MKRKVTTSKTYDYVYEFRDEIVNDFNISGAKQFKRYLKSHLENKGIASHRIMSFLENGEFEIIKKLVGKSLNRRVKIPTFTEVCISEESIPPHSLIKVPNIALSEWIRIKREVDNTELVEKHLVIPSWIQEYDKQIRIAAILFAAITAIIIGACVLLIKLYN